MITFCLPDAGAERADQTLPVASVPCRPYGLRDLICCAALLAMILIILFLFAQKQIIQGMVDGAIK